MQLQRPAIIACILLPVAALTSMDCGLFTFPEDGPKALAANLQFIKLNLDLVDDTGEPLDSVSVAVTRRALQTNIVLWGVYDQKKPDPPRMVDKHFAYESLGNCAVEVTFSKVGYDAVTLNFANADVIRPDAIWAPPAPYTCINVKTHPITKVTLYKSPPTK